MASPADETSNLGRHIRKTLQDISFIWQRSLNRNNGSRYVIYITHAEDNSQQMKI